MRKSSTEGDRHPFAHREALTDSEHLVPLWCRIPGELIVKVEARAAELGLTVDQFVSLALAATLPDIIAESLRRSTYQDAGLATWPSPRKADDLVEAPVEVCS